MDLSAAALLTRLQAFNGWEFRMLGEIGAAYRGEAAYFEALIALTRG